CRGLGLCCAHKTGENAADVRREASAERALKRFAGTFRGRQGPTMTLGPAGPAEPPLRSSVTAKPAVVSTGVAVLKRCRASPVIASVVNTPASTGASGRLESMIQN